MTTERKNLHKQFRSNGKLLISGEYLVLHGAKSLAVPLRFGQIMEVVETENDKRIIEWRARQNNTEWFFTEVDINTLDVIATNDISKADYLTRILLFIEGKKPGWFQKFKSLSINTELEFDRNWGFGSNSTLMVNLAEWAGIDPFELNQFIAGGSGYDIAAAMSNQSVLYRLENKKPVVEKVSFSPPFAKSLYFVYRGNKQNSFNEIKRYNHSGNEFSNELINEITDISKKLISTQDLMEFQLLLDRHEELVGAHIGKKPVKVELFSDFPGGVKSLGAWGGDFMLMCSNLGSDYIEKYLIEKGFSVFFRFNDLVLTEEMVYKEIEL